jgi:hypothetical protein
MAVGHHPSSKSTCTYLCTYTAAMAVPMPMHRLQRLAAAQLAAFPPWSSLIPWIPIS